MSAFWDNNVYVPDTASFPSRSGSLRVIGGGASGEINVQLTGALSVLDPGNSTTTPLAASASFTGTAVDTLGYAGVSYFIQTDVPSATGGIQRWWSPDGINWTTWSNDSLEADRIGLGNGSDLTVRCHARYFRLIYQNGASPQTYLRIQTRLDKYIPAADTVGVAHTLTDGDDALITKTVLAGRVRTSQDGNGKTYGDVTIDAQGALSVAQVGTAGAFGSMLTVAEQVKINLSFPYAINSRLVHSGTINGGTVGWSAGRAMLSTGINAAGSATLESRSAIQYVPGQGILVRFTTVYSPGVSGSLQECGIGDNNDGFFFGFSGSQFGINRRRGGVDNWTFQSAWNGDDKFDGTGPSQEVLDPTKGYPYQIQYQWLGFGAIKYFIENPHTGQFILVHTIRYAGTDTLTSINNPTLPLHARVLNKGNTSNIVLYTPSMGALTEGIQDNPGSSVRWEFNRAFTGAPTTGVRVFNLMNKATNIFGGTNTNRQPIHFDHLSFRAASAKDLYITLFRDPTITGPVWTDVNTLSSIAQTDVVGTTNGTGGIPLMTWAVAGGTTINENVTEYNLTLKPGETWSFVVFAESTTVDGRLAISWHEEQ